MNGKKYQINQVLCQMPDYRFGINQLLRKKNEIKISVFIYMCNSSVPNSKNV